MKPVVLFCSSLALLLGLVLGAPAHASDQDRVRKGVASGVYKPLTSIMADITRQYPGRVVDVESKSGARGGLRYEITLIDAQGHKQELLVDAATGQVIGREEDLSRRAVSLGELADYLSRVEQQHGRRVIDAEFEITRKGQTVYELKLAPDGFDLQRLLIDARNGEPLSDGAPAKPSASPVVRMPEMLRYLSGRYRGRVLEAELENGEAPDAYYEVELLRDNGEKLELRVDARTLAVRERMSDD